MSKIIDVKIGVGTYSYVMGGESLINIEQDFPAEWKEIVRVSGAIHIEGCDEYKMKPPFASVNGKVMEQASAVKLKNAIAKEIELLKL